METNKVNVQDFFMFSIKSFKIIERRSGCFSLQTVNLVISILKPDELSGLKLRGRVDGVV